jgi:hypothetical protein
MGGGLLNPLNYETVYSTPELSKIGQITPQAVFRRRIYYSNSCIATITTDLLQAVLPFFYFGWIFEKS